MGKNKEERLKSGVQSCSKASPLRAQSVAELVGLGNAVLRQYTWGCSLDRSWEESLFLRCCFFLYSSLLEKNLFGCTWLTPTYHKVEITRMALTKLRGLSTCMRTEKNKNRYKYRVRTNQGVYCSIPIMPSNLRVSKLVEWRSCEIDKVEIYNVNNGKYEES